ncbi:MAG: ABC transporter permease [Burkholderiaceae bacterium]|nr:ABC transporter permease [Burkholderiaceae bacterium]
MATRLPAEAGEPLRLRRALRRAQRARVLMGLALIAPLFLWIVVNFAVPVAILLFKSVDDREVILVLPRVVKAVAAWDGNELPPETAFAALAQDLREAHDARTLHIAAKRLNNERPGFQALLNRTARALPADAPASWKEQLRTFDERWVAIDTWRVLARTASPWTPVHLLSALDLKLDDNAELARVAPDRRVFLTAWGRTFWIAGVVTLVCVVLGFPLAHLIATAPPRLGNVLLVLVLLPFWMSLLVRTSAWLVLLQTEGVVNDVGINLRLWSERIQLIHNRTGLYVTMTHILLPYIVLPLQAIMKRIPDSYWRAALSLGANPLTALARVYLPLTLQGVGSGALLVFILAIGYYVTPALVGGPNDQMISYYIAFFTNVTLNWQSASALSVWLLLLTFAVFAIFKSVFGLDRMKIG